MSGPTVHDPIRFMCGDTWIIEGSCTNVDGSAMDLTGAQVEWVLDSVDGVTNFVRLSIGAGVTVPDAVNGLVQITVDPTKTAAVNPGDYKDTLRVTLPSGVVSTQWLGAITAMARPT